MPDAAASVSTQTLRGDAPALLAESAALVERALDTWLPTAATAPERLHAAMRHSVLGGGKRLRPALVLAACRTCGGADAPALPAMVAVELLHTYTLIHDDLPAMDDDDLRRGRPTCHKAFDEATAILAGDALQALAFAAVAELGAGAVKVLARAAGSLGVVGGQAEDLAAEGAAIDTSPATLARLERIHRGKTAALLRAACELGAIAAGVDHERCSALAAFGEQLGLAFQIADDVLDATADAATLGKTPGKDAVQGKLTYVAVHGLDAARSQAQQRLDAALAEIAPFARRASSLRTLARFCVERQS